MTSSVAVQLFETLTPNTLQGIMELDDYTRCMTFWRPARDGPHKALGEGMPMEARGHRSIIDSTVSNKLAGADLFLTWAEANKKYRKKHGLPVVKCVAPRYMYDEFWVKEGYSTNLPFWA